MQYVSLVNKHHFHLFTGFKNQSMYMQMLSKTWDEGIILCTIIKGMFFFANQFYTRYCFILYIKTSIF